MTRKADSSASKARGVPALLAAAALALGVPSVSLAIGGKFQPIAEAGSSAPLEIMGIFTPAGVEPELARRVAVQASHRPFRFTPAENPARRGRTVTVAVRVDDEVAKAISVRSAIDAAATGAGVNGAGISELAAARYNLGIARGYKGFARPVVLASERRTEKADLGLAQISSPDLASFAPGANKSEETSGRLQPRVALEGRDKPGRSEGTLEALGTQTVDVGGAYRVTRNLDVTAGVRISQQRDRLAPLTDAEQDNQAVYIGTQFRF